MDEQIVRATRDQILEFKSSILWKDMKRELGKWKTGFKKEALSIVDNIAEENPSTPSVLTHLGDINGRIKTVDYMLGILDMFLQILEDQQSIKN